MYMPYCICQRYGREGPPDSARSAAPPLRQATGDRRRVREATPARWLKNDHGNRGGWESSTRFEYTDQRIAHCSLRIEHCAPTSQPLSLHIPYDIDTLPAVTEFYCFSPAA